jgi:diguanylate cyclase (GGDEF)-like protein
MPDKQFPKPSRTLRSETLTAGVVGAGLILFVGLGGATFSSILEGIMGADTGLDPDLSVAFILNIALLLFGWRRYVGLKAQATSAAEVQAKLVAASSIDFVTSLVNRATFHEAGEEMLRTNSSLTLLVFDLDHFKKVNDQFGHAAGDELLKVVANIIVSLAPAKSKCARLGGDEFAVLLDGASEEQANAIAQQILSGIAKPVNVVGGVAHVSASIGLSANSACETFSAMLRRADIAMYQAKKQGRNRIAWFDDAMEAEVRRISELESDMRRGIPCGEFVPFYQPQYSLQSGDLYGFEVLARWLHPTRGLIEPTEFIPVAEGTGLIATLSLSVMQQALSDARAWDPSLMIAVNISPVQLKDPILSQRIAKLLNETNFPPQRLEVEITESALFEDLTQALDTIGSLKALGITVSLDDFGTGYSSLSQLRALPFDRIKIDRSFVVSMLENDESTAEGIETDAVRGALRTLGCSEGQGWHYGRPLAHDQICERYPDVVLGKRVVQHCVASVAGLLSSEPIELPDRRDNRRRGVRQAAA